MKRIEILILLGMFFLSGSCQQNSHPKDKIEFDAKVPYNLLLKNLGEPTGDEIEKYSFYMLFYKIAPFENLELFSLAERNDTVYSSYKITSASNMKFFSNELEADSAVSYLTLFRNYKEKVIDDIKDTIERFKIKELNNTKGASETSFDGEYLGLLIYDHGKLIMIDRMGAPDKYEANYLAFFKAIKQKLFK